MLVCFSCGDRLLGTWVHFRRFLPGQVLVVERWETLLDLGEMADLRDLGTRVQFGKSV